MDIYILKVAHCNELENLSYNFQPVVMTMPNGQIANLLNWFAIEFFICFMAEDNAKKSRISQSIVFLKNIHLVNTVVFHKFMT